MNPNIMNPINNMVVPTYVSVNKAGFVNSNVPYVSVNNFSTGIVSPPTPVPAGYMLVKKLTYDPDVGFGTVFVKEKIPLLYQTKQPMVLKKPVVVQQPMVIKKPVVVQQPMVIKKPVVVQQPMVMRQPLLSSKTNKQNSYNYLSNPHIKNIWNKV
jgi:hypothetical protein